MQGHEEASETKIFNSSLSEEPLVAALLSPVSRLVYYILGLSSLSSRLLGRWLGLAHT